MALSQHNRLRSSRDFSRVYRKGKRAATKHLAVRALKRPAAKVVAKQQQRLKSVDGHSSTLLLRSSADDASLQGPRFGISISKKVHKRAVVRNRIKRQLKAIIRAIMQERPTAITPEWQIVIVVRPPAVECSFDNFLRELEYLLQKLSVLSQTA